MTIDDLLEYRKQNPTKFIEYCALIISKNGDIIIPNNGHMNTLEQTTSLHSMGAMSLLSMKIIMRIF